MENADERVEEPPAGNAVRIAIPTPDKYTKSMDFGLWRQRMENYYDMINVPMNHRGRHTVLMLDNETFKVLQALGIDQQEIDAYVPLMDRLHHALQSREGQANIRHKFRHRKQALNETQGDFARALLDLGRRAYPHADDRRIRQQLQLDYFVCGLTDGDIMERLMLEQFNDIFEALERAESIFTGKQTRERLEEHRPIRQVDVINEVSTTSTTEVVAGMDRLKLLDEIKTAIAEQLANLNRDAARRRGGGYQGAGPDDEEKWKCRQCSVWNYSRRVRCITCGAPKEGLRNNYGRNGYRNPTRGIALDYRGRGRYNGGGWNNRGRYNSAPRQFFANRPNPAVREEPPRPPPIPTTSAPPTSQTALN